jgi:hypothetical protein
MLLFLLFLWERGREEVEGRCVGVGREFRNFDCELKFEHSAALSKGRLFRLCEFTNTESLS